MKIKSLIILSYLLFSTVLFAQVDNASTLLDLVRKDLVSMSANFEQYEIDANERMSDKSTGKMWLNSPNQFKWIYEKPVEQLILANGEQVWIYDEDLEQVTIKPQKSSANPIYVLLNKEQTEKNYNLELLEKSDIDEKTSWISMLPKVASDEIKQVWLGINKDNDIAVLKLQNQMDNIVIFEFNNIKRNPELAKDFFTFSIPEGTDIIREAATFGESEY